MSSKKDMRREDLIVPFIEPEDKSSENMSSTLSSTMPMAALFTRNKMIGWVAVVFTIQTWLAESPAQRKAASTPQYLNVLFGLLAVFVSYLPLFLPPQQLPGASQVQAPGPVQS